jgi:hypothetical protein
MKTIFCCLILSAAGVRLASADDLTLATAPPVVVKTVPQAGAADVSPGLTEIQVTFSKPMHDGSWSWCNLGEESFPEMAGKIHYLPDGRTCVMPVKLQPGKFYATWLNTENFRNFKDRDRQPAVPYLLTFQTTAAEEGPASKAATPTKKPAAKAAKISGKKVDLLNRYPTTLTAGDGSGEHARPWEFSAADIFQLSRISFKVGNALSIETGPADLGIGHCADGAVWAVVLPHESGKLTSAAASGDEKVAHVWLRFHPGELNHLFPSGTVFDGGDAGVAGQMRTIANTKFTSSWHAGMNAMIPEPKDLTVDVDTSAGTRRFFAVDTAAGKADYASYFATRGVKPAPTFSVAAAEEAFDTLWKAFDRDYAMFVLRPDVDWTKLRDQYRPKALAAKSTYEFAGVCAEMLKPLRDLHVWLRVAGADVPVFNRPRSANSNPSAHQALLGGLRSAGPNVKWAVTPDKIGYLAIYAWNNAQIPSQCHEALEEFRDTRGLIVDVRLNGGGSEDQAMEVAGRFLPKQFVYAYSQFRNGPSHTNLTAKLERNVSPGGPWRYNRPVVLLIGQKCMSSNESFVAMMSGDPNLTTMGDHTCGSSGNPRILQLPLNLTVSVPRWIDYLPDGTALDEGGFQPRVVFKPEPGAFEGNRDDLLTAALERLRQVPLPEKPIEGPRPGA